ncbi:MIT domain-containing protein 1 [Taenia crassiceps]|uniref:MIT domain-containing protein 1 n=1 Tax=Taenia crassiceps TaxID=6207 RepID=A0ABR4QVK0_9CEST
MAESLLSSSSQIIVRALSLESEGKLTQSLVCYEEDCKYHEHIDIADGETGYGYRKLFSRFLDDGRIEKFSHFCEVLVGSASPVQRIILQTGVDCEKSEEQLKKFETLKQDLQLRKVDFIWNFSPLLHDRQIRFNNGWVIKIGRGLDYIKNAPHKFVGLGVHDFDFRPCLQTTIDIFYEGEPPL